MYCDTIMYMKTKVVPFMDIAATYSDLPHRRLVDLRPDGLAEIPAFGRLSYAKSRPDLPIHRHFGCLEFHYRDRGEQHFQVNNEMYLMRGGDLFVTLPDEPHSTGGYPMETGVMYWLVLKVPRKGEGLLGLVREGKQCDFASPARSPDSTLSRNGADEAPLRRNTAIALSARRPFSGRSAYAWQWSGSCWRSSRELTATPKCPPPIAWQKPSR